MSKKKILFFVSYLVVILLSVFATAIYYNFSLKLCKVYVSRYAIGQRERICADMLEEIKMPRAYISEDIFLNYDDILDKYVNVGKSIPKGSFFYKDTISTLDNSKDSFISELKEGEVAYDLMLNNISGNFSKLLKGMNIDLYLTVNRQNVYSDLLVGDARIIGMYDAENKEIKDYDTTSRINSITIAICKEAVNYLNKARALGELSIVINNDLYKDRTAYVYENSAVFALLK